MLPLPTPLQPRRLRLLALAVVASLAGCGGGDGGDGGTGPETPRLATVRLERNALTMAPGDSLQLTAATFDQNGAPFPLTPGVFVNWASSDPAVEVDGTGLTIKVKAKSFGAARVTVRVQGASDSADVSVPRAVALVRKIGGDGQGGTAGAPLASGLAVRVEDVLGGALAGVTVRFAVTAGGGSVTPASAATDAAGVARASWTPGAAAGEQTVEARADGAAADRAAVFRARVDGALLLLEQLSVDTLRPTSTVTLRGRGFDPAPGGTRVTVDGVPVAVTAATDRELTVQIPDHYSLPCRASARVPVRVELAGSSPEAPVASVLPWPLRTASAREPALGQRADYDAVESLCLSLPAGGRYLVSVHHTSKTATVQSPYLLRGTAEAAAQADAAPARVRLAAPSRSVIQGGEDAHLRIMEESREWMRRMGPPPRRRTAGGARLALNPRPPKAVGDTMQLRVRGPGGICTGFSTIAARVAYAGPRVIVAEDPGNAVQGAAMDAQYQAMGRELDGPMLDVLTTYFGNPLAMDAETDGNGKVVILVTQTVNLYNVGSLGFITGNDFYPRSMCAGSNVGEFAYIRAADAGTAPETWLRDMRATSIHEVKHIVSVAERISRNAVFEEGWLEESTARISEEIWARGVYGFERLGNTSFDAGVRCSLVFTDPACAGKPWVMMKHYMHLYEYARGSTFRSPLGGDGTFYGSGWALVRYAADHSPLSEVAFFRALISDTELAGVANLEARAGRPWPELLSGWSLAMVADDRPGFTVADARLRFPSWNLYDVFRGMNQFAPSTYSVANPWTVVPAGQPFEALVTGARGGSGTVYEVAPPAGEKEVLELRLPGVAPGVFPAVSSSLRVSILRVQ